MTMTQGDYLFLLRVCFPSYGQQKCGNAIYLDKQQYDGILIKLRSNNTISP